MCAVWILHLRHNSSWLRIFNINIKQVSENSKLFYKLVLSKIPVRSAVLKSRLYLFLPSMVCEAMSRKVVHPQHNHTVITVSPLTRLPKLIQDRIPGLTVINFSIPGGQWQHITFNFYQSIEKRDKYSLSTRTKITTIVKHLGILW